MPRVGTASILAMLVVSVATAAAATGPQAPTTTVSFFDLQTEAPAAWARQEPSSSMRLLQMTVPGSGAGDAELVVFFFGQGQGGDVEANIARWRSQFTGDDGGAVEPRVERFDVGSMTVTVAELTGAYTRNVGGAPAAAVPGQTLRAAIIETGRGSLFAQMHGPSATVEAQRAAFDAFLHGLRPAG